MFLNHRWRCINVRENKYCTAVYQKLTCQNVPIIIPTNTSTAGNM